MEQTLFTSEAVHTAARPVAERLVLSLYDYTETWAEPYKKAGYPVICWDKKVERDIISEKFWEEVMCYSSYVYGILAAPPCTYFAASGARWWPQIPEDELREMIALVEWVFMLLPWCENLQFFALENPVGRIESLVPQLRKLQKFGFHPSDFGDPYTKKTFIWGKFHEPKRRPVLPLFGSQMHTVSGWNKEKQKEERSATPAGFAKAFFQANQ